MARSQTINRVFLQAAYDQSLTTVVDLTSLGFTAAQLALAGAALITNNDVDLRYTIDGTTSPTATKGHLLKAGDELELIGWALVNQIKVVSTGAATKLQITLFKQ
jgi:hypothetical protein